ncbi:MAG: sulfatase, partial [Planctomycetota bacterium]
NIPADRTDSAWATDEALAFMQRNGDGPWMCQVHYQDPHTPFTCPEPWFSRVAIEAMQLLPDAQPGEFDDKPAFYRTLWERRHGDWWQEGYPGWNDEHEGRRIPVPCAFPDRDMAERAATAMQATLGMVAHIDHQVGRLLTALEDSGLSGDTIVVFTSDHGELHGHHGLWGKGLPAYEDCQRVPLLVWAPQRFPARGGVAQLANTADLPLSLCRLAGIDPAPGMQGCDLSRFWRGEEDRTQPATVIENRATRASVYQTTLVTDRHKLVMYRDQDDWECYDLQADPDQHRNLWGDPTQQALHADLLRCHAQTRMRLESVVAPRTVFA